MTAYFADASYWIALITPTDEFHELAIEYTILLEREQIVTTQLVLNEVLNPRSGATPQRRIPAVRLVDRIIRNSQVTVVPQNPEQFYEALNLLRDRIDDKEWSVTDCASFQVMWRLGIRGALTSDHHFEQASLEVLLRNSHQETPC